METLIIYYNYYNITNASNRVSLLRESPLTCILSPSGGEETEVDLETGAKRLW